MVGGRQNLRPPIHGVKRMEVPVGDTTPYARRSKLRTSSYWTWKVVCAFKQKWTFLKYYFETILSVAPSRQNLLETLQKAGRNEARTKRSIAVARDAHIDPRETARCCTAVSGMLLS